MVLASWPSTLLSPGGDNIMAAPGARDRLIVAAADGVWRLARDKENEWQLAGRALEGTFISGLTRTPSGALIAATHHLGMARSDDEGRSWRWINKGITQFDFWVVKAARLDGKDVLLAGTMPAHLFISEDGETWRELSALRSVPTADKWFFPPPPHLGHVKDIVVLNEHELIVGIEVGALLRSTDGGESFEELPLDPDFTEIDIHRVIVDGTRPDRLVVATGWGLKSSYDRGKTWTRHDAEGINYPDAMVMHPSDPDFLIVGGALGYPPNWYKINRARPRIARSRDGGKSWERLRNGFPDGQRAAIGAMSLSAAGEELSIFVGDTDGQIFESQDRGDSWRIIFETGAVSKGEHYRGLVKSRPPMTDLDALTFAAAGQNRVDTAKA